MSAGAITTNLSSGFPGRKQRDQMASYLFERGVDTAKYLDEVMDVVAENYGYEDDCPMQNFVRKQSLLSLIITLSQERIWII